MDIVRHIIRALKIDKWFRKNRLYLYGAGFGLLILVLAVLLGGFWRGVGAVVFSATAWFVYRGVDWLVHRIRVTTEAGIPLSPVRISKELVAERAKFADADARWALFTRAQGVKYDGMQPKLHRHQTTADGDVRAFVNLAGIGGNLDVIRRNVADGTLAGVMDCKEVSIRETKLNRAWLTFYNHPPLERGTGLADLPVPRPGFVSFGVEEDGDAAEIEHGLSVMSVGETGSGKSKAMWNMFASMLRSGVPTEIDLIDPKGSELAVFKPLADKQARVGNILIRSYSRTLPQADLVMARFVTEMKTRQDMLDGRQLIEATEALPARYVWADEMNELASLYSKPDSPMVTLVSQGRSSMDALMASVQVAKVANLGHIRDQIPLNIVMRTKTKENTKAALPGVEDVPPAHLIPRDTPGVGYYIRSNGEQRKFRTAHVTDKQLDDLAHGKLPDGMVMRAPEKYAGPPCFGYIGPERFPKLTGRPIAYVGIAGADGTRHPVATRRAQHRRSDVRWCMKHYRVENIWNVHVVDKQLQVFKFPSRAAAELWEQKTIKELRPFWNIRHNGDNPDSNEALARRAGVKTRVLDAGREWVQFGRESWALHQVKAGWRKGERVEKVRARRDEFEQRVLADSYR